MDIIINETILTLSQLCDVLIEYQRYTFPDDDGNTIYLEWTNRQGITVKMTEDGLMITQEVG